MKYLVMNIGCIECGVSSKVVGVFTSETLAEQVAANCDRLFNWREGGQNSFKVYPLPYPNSIDEEYATAYPSSTIDGEVI